MNIVIVGAGRVGLANAVFLAQGEHSVTVQDTDHSLIRKLRAKINPYKCDYLNNLFTERIDVSFISDLLGEEAAPPKIAFLCIPWIGAVQYAELVIRLNERYKETLEGIVLRGTMSPQQAIDLSEHLGENPVKEKMVLFPEFLVEGKESAGVIKPIQNYLGFFGNNREKKDKLYELIYQLLPATYEIVNNPATAAAIKLWTNVMLAFKITGANIMKEILEPLGVNIKTVSKCIEEDPRLGTGYFTPGIGYGGNCLPWAVEQFSHSVLDSINKYNSEQILDHYAKLLDGPTLFFGYNFKAGVYDHRRANQLNLIVQTALHNEVYVTDDEYHPVISQWWTDDPISVIPKIKNLVIFYRTRALTTILDYMSGEANEDDVNYWKSLKIIDFR